MSLAGGRRGLRIVGGVLRCNISSVLIHLILHFGRIWEGLDVLPFRIRGCCAGIGLGLSGTFGFGFVRLG